MLRLALESTAPSLGSRRVGPAAGGGGGRTGSATRPGGEKAGRRQAPLDGVNKVEVSESTNRDLRLLRLLIERNLEDRSSGAALTRKSTLAVVPCRYNPDGQMVELRFEAHRGVQACVTERWWHDPNRDLDMLCRSAEQFVESIESVWDARDEIRDWIGEMRDAVRREIAKGRRRGIPYRLVSSGLGEIEAGCVEFPYAAFEVERLGASLVPETITLKLDAAEEVAEVFAGMRDAQEARRLRRLVLNAAGADGEIDIVALRAMQLSGCDVPAILAALPDAPGGILDVDLPNVDDRRIVLFWRDGSVHANFRLADKVHWRDGSVGFDDLPNWFPEEPKGHMLSDFIKHQALPEGLRISGGYRSKKTATARVTVPFARFNSSTGEILAA